MFVNPKILKKLMKEAFKANFLIIGRNEDNMYIQGQYWKLICKRNFVPKTIYAEIIELAGEIPEEGECFCAGKEGNQMQINSMTIDFPANARVAEVTDFILEAKSGTLQRLLQLASGKIALINEVFHAATKGAHYDEEQGETQAIGPYVDFGHGIFWKNNTGTLQACFRVDDEHEETLIEMENVNLTKCE